MAQPPEAVRPLTFRSRGMHGQCIPRGSPSAGYRVADFRRKPRTHEPFAARVRGIRGRGDPFEAEGVLDNLSTGRRYTRLRRHVEETLQLFVFLHLATRLMPGKRTACRGARKGGAVGAASPTAPAA